MGLLFFFPIHQLAADESSTEDTGLFFSRESCWFPVSLSSANSFRRAADGNKVVFSTRGSGSIPSLRFLLSAKAKMKSDFGSSYELEIVV